MTLLTPQLANHNYVLISSYSLKILLAVILFIILITFEVEFFCFGTNGKM